MPKKTDEKKDIILRLPRQLLNELEQMAKERYQSKQEVIRQFIIEGLRENRRKE
jgi:metal-responsive CopG/Arc/MetJ family transcriptional regulator